LFRNVKHIVGKLISNESNLLKQNNRGIRKPPIPLKPKAIREEGEYQEIVDSRLTSNFEAPEPEPELEVQSLP
jgi:hypothetical protein